MRRVELQVGELLVETEAADTRLEGVPQRLREAFELLARRLQASPAVRRGQLRELALETLAVSPETARALLGPGGAERLADELYARLIRQM